MWLPLEEAIERLKLATPSIAKLQEAISMTLVTKYIPATSTMPATTAPALTLVPQQ